MTPEKARIILGDDDSETIESLKYILESRGHQIVFAFGNARNGLVGFDEAKKQGVQAAVLDRSLIDRGGFAGQELINECKSSGIPIVCISGIGPPNWADHFVSKREHPNRFLETIEKL